MSEYRLKTIFKAKLEATGDQRLLEYQDHLESLLTQVLSEFQLNAGLRQELNELVFEERISAARSFFTQTVASSDVIPRVQTDGQMIEEVGHHGEVNVTQFDDPPPSTSIPVDPSASSSSDNCEEPIQKDDFSLAIQSVKYGISFKKYLGTKELPKSSNFWNELEEGPEWILITFGELAVPISQNGKFNVYSFNFGSISQSVGYLSTMLKNVRKVKDVVIYPSAEWFFQWDSSNRSMGSLEEGVISLISLCNILDNSPFRTLHWLGFPVDPKDNGFKGRLGIWNRVMATVFKEQGKFVDLQMFFPLDLEQIERPDEEKASLLDDETNAFLLMEAMNYLMDSECTNIIGFPSSEDEIDVEEKKIDRSSERQVHESLKSPKQSDTFPDKGLTVSRTEDEHSLSQYEDALSEIAILDMNSPNGEDQIQEETVNLDETLVHPEEDVSTEHTVMLKTKIAMEESCHIVMTDSIPKENAEAIALLPEEPLYAHLELCLSADEQALARMFKRRIRFDVQRMDVNIISKPYYNVVRKYEPFFEDPQVFLADDRLFGRALKAFIKTLITKVRLEDLGNMFKEDLKKIEFLAFRCQELLNQPNKVVGKYCLGNLKDIFCREVGAEEAVNTDYMKKAGKSEVNVKPRPADPLPVFENNFVGGVLKKVVEEGGIDSVIGNIRTGLMLVGDQDLGILFTENFIKPTSCVGCNITPLITTTALCRIFMRVSPYFKNEELVAVDKFCCMGFEVNSALDKMIKVFNPEMMGKMYRQELDDINPKGKEIRGLLQHDDNTVGLTAYLLIQQTLFDDKNNNSKKKTLKNAKRVPCEHKGELDPEATKSFPLNQKFVNLVRTQMEASNAPEVVNLTKKSIQKVKDNVLGRRFRTKIVQALGHKGVEAGIYGIVASLERGIQQEAFWASQDCCIGKKLRDTITLLLNYPLVEQGDAFRRELLLTRLYFEEKFPNFDRLLEEDRELLAAIMSCVVKKLLCDGNDSSDGINCLHPHPEYIVDPELFDKVLQTIKQCGDYSKLLHNPLKTSKHIRKMIAEHNDFMERGLKCQMDNVGKTFNEFWEALIRGNFEKMVTNFNRNIVRSPTDDSTTSRLRKATYLLVKETEVGGFQNWDELFTITQRFDALSVTVPIAKILLIDIETLGTMYRKCLRGLNVKNEEICGVLKSPDYILGRFAVVIMYYLLFPEEANKSKAVLPKVSGKIQPLSLDREFYNEVEKMVELQPEQYKESLRKKMELITDETLGRRFRTHIAELAAENKAENVIMKSLVLLDPFFKSPEVYSKRSPCCLGRALRSILKIILSLTFLDVMLSLRRNGDLHTCIFSTACHRHLKGGTASMKFAGMATLYMLDKMLFKSPIPTDGSTCRHEIAPDEENDIFKQALIKIAKEEKLTTVLHNPKESQKRLKDIIKSEVKERWGPVDLNLDKVEIRFSELVFKLSKSEFPLVATYFKLSLLNIDECVKSTTTILKKAIVDVFFESEDMDFHIPYTREECAGFDAHFFGHTVGHSIFKMILMECDDVGESFRRSLKKFVGNDPRIESLLKKCDDYLGIFFFVLIDILLLCDVDGSGEDDSLIHKILSPEELAFGSFEELERKVAASPPRLIASSMRKVLAFNQKDQSLMAENFKDIIFGTMRLLTPELEGLSDDEIAQIKDKKLAQYLKDFIKKALSIDTNVGSVVKSATSAIRNLHPTLRLQIPAHNAYWTTVIFLSIKKLISDRDVVDTL